ncbi:BAR domain-containing protein [Streptomyces viridosporus]|uniref:hypothetical protein n=1 Tax=Streptomyces viridosporus TaxID=67581 RepID=UPI0036FAA2A3
MPPDPSAVGQPVVLTPGEERFAVRFTDSVPGLVQGPAQQRLTGLLLLPVGGIFTQVVDHARRAHPDPLPTVTRLHRGLRPYLSAGAHMAASPQEPRAARQGKAERTRRILALLSAHEPAGTDDAHARAIQNATAQPLK